MVSAFAVSHHGEFLNLLIRTFQVNNFVHIVTPNKKYKRSLQNKLYTM